MEIFPDISIGDTISFSVFPSAIIGTTFDYCQITAVLDYDTVKNFIDVDSLHSNVIPTLPENSPDNPSQYPYLKILLPSEQYTYIGLPWIDLRSLIKHQESRIKFIIERVGSEDLNKINLLLNANGYNAIEWHIESIPAVM